MATGHREQQCHEETNKDTTRPPGTGVERVEWTRNETARDETTHSLVSKTPHTVSMATKDDTDRNRRIDDEPTALEPDVEPSGDEPPHGELAVTDFTAESTQDTSSSPLSNAPTPRPYIEIRPSSSGLSTRAVVASMQKLYVTLESLTEDAGLLQRLGLRSRAPPPTVEWVFVGDGRADTSIRWLVGVTGTPAAGAHRQDEQEASESSRGRHKTIAGRDREAAEDATVTHRLHRIERILRQTLPSTYELRRVHWHPEYVTEHLPAPVVSPPPSNPHERVGPHHPAITVDSPYVAGVEYRGRATHTKDWQLPLMRFGDPLESSASASAVTSPSTATGAPRRTRDQQQGQVGSETQQCTLSGVIETIRDAETPVIYQVVCRPIEPWTREADAYRWELENGEPTLASKAFELLFPRSPEDREAFEPAPSSQARLDALETRNTHQSFGVCVRAVALTRDTPVAADSVARQLATELEAVGSTHHRIEGDVRTDDDLHTEREPPGSQLFTDLVERRWHAPTYEDRPLKNGFRRQPSRGLVVTPAELPSFCLVDGAGLTPNGQRALSLRHSERTGLVLPPPGVLAQYTGPGQKLCQPLTHDRRPYLRPFVNPVALQDKHLVIAGTSGSGKSVTTQTGQLSNVVATAGPEIILDHKGGQTSVEFMQSYYAAYGTLEDVIYFDLSRVLPALSFFDIRPLLNAGVPRQEAVERTVGHYEEILRTLWGADQYDAKEAPKAIRMHARALFDPVHGSDAFSNDDLREALSRTLSEQITPPVSNEKYERYFREFLQRRHEVFGAAMGGAISRVEKIDTSSRLAPLFDHVHRQDPGHADGDNDNDDASVTHPAFSFADIVDEDVTVVFDFGGMETEIKAALTLVLLSDLWTALESRATGAKRPESSEASHPQVNLYLEEAGSVANSPIVDTLLSQGRSFGLSVMLGVQYLGQLRSRDDDDDTYYETLNETATFMVGNVAADSDITNVLATADMPPEAVARRLAAMRRGEWLVRPGALFGEETPRPFLAESLPAPTGHPASDEPLAEDSAKKLRFEAALVRAEERTRRRYGRAHRDPGVTANADAGTGTNDSTGGTQSTAGRADSDDATSADEPNPDPAVEAAQNGSLLPHTKRFPVFLSYDASRRAIQCVECGTRYNPSEAGIRDAIECCHSLDEVDRDDIPTLTAHLKLAPDEIRGSPWSPGQLRFIQTVWNAQQGNYSDLEYDITRDSMVRLREYVGVSVDAVEALVDAGLIREDTTLPHLLYSVTAAGRDVVGEHYREGVDYGPGRGDLGESSEHIMMVELATWLAEQRCADPEHDAVTVSPYHQLDDGRRLDVACLDAEGEIVVAIEAERINNDAPTAAPTDFDKMADCGAAEAVWVVSGLSAASKLTEALHDPADGEPRIDRTYSSTSQTQKYRIDEPGFTEIHTVRGLIKRREQAAE